MATASFQSFAELAPDSELARLQASLRAYIEQTSDTVPADAQADARICYAHDAFAYLVHQRRLREQNVSAADVG